MAARGLALYGGVAAGMGKEGGWKYSVVGEPFCGLFRKELNTVTNNHLHT